MNNFKLNNMNTIGVIGVAVAIGTVLAAFGALYNTWGMAGRFDRQQAQIDELYKQDQYIYDNFRKEIEDLKHEVKALKVDTLNLQHQINELGK